jgi:Flp pilus assembly protein protease CpaA
MNSVVWLPVGLLLLASIQDVWTREVSDSFSIAILLSAVVSIAAGWWQLSWLAASLGVVVGLLVAAPLFFLGGFGGADVKLVAALGAWFGPIALLGLLFWVAMIGGVLALIAKVRDRADLAYVPAIAVGALIHVWWPVGLMGVLQ